MTNPTSTAIFLAVLFFTGTIQRGFANAIEQEDVVTRILATNVCPEDCNTNNCNLARCSRCEFTCGGRCTYMEEWKIYAPKRPLDPPATKCPITTFEDVTSQKFADAIWNRYPMPGRPYGPETAPVITDLNGDGVIDFYTNSHGRSLAVSVKVPCKNGDTEPCYKLRSVRERVQMTNKQADSHGSNNVDLDGDGIPDLLIAVGGGLGGAKGKEPVLTENTVLWGSRDRNGNVIFKGGRDAAEAAGLSMRSARGRFNYILDANGDGLLDIFFSTDRPKVNALAPGYLYINQGDRTWKKDDVVSEYSTSMLVTDVDGDGFANEFVIDRDLCYPQTRGNYLKEVNEYCKTRPLGTTAVYKYNPKTKKMEDIGKKYTNSIPLAAKQPPCCAPGTIGTFNEDNKNCYARSTASGDFDGDLLADQVFLYNTKLVFYFSTDRPAGTLPFGGQWVGAEEYLPTDCAGKVLRIVDLDNDGKEEILVGCSQASKFLVYTQGKTKRDWTLKNGCNNGRALGDINKLALAAPNEDDYKVACKSNTNTAKEFCNRYKKRGKNQPIERITNAKLAGISVADLNNDGFLDVILAHYKGHTRFLLNKPSGGKQRNRFIAFELQGLGIGAGNVYGIGATIILYSNDCVGCEKQMREVSSHQHATDKWGYQDGRWIFGLGPNGKPTKVVVRWPNGSVQTKNLSNWKFSAVLKPMVIKQCKYGSDDCRGSSTPDGDQGEPEGDQGEPDGDQGEPEGDQGEPEGDQGEPGGDQGDSVGGGGGPCADTKIKFRFDRPKFMGCRYVNKFPKVKEFRCNRVTEAGKPVKEFCPKSCGVCG